MLINLVVMGIEADPCSSIRAGPGNSIGYWTVFQLENLLLPSKTKNNYKAPFLIFREGFFFVEQFVLIKTGFLLQFVFHIK